MDDVVSTFPLMRLPNNAIRNTFRTLKYPQIFEISLLSKKSKDLVESLKLETNAFYVQVNSSIFLIMLFFPNRESVCFELWQPEVNAHLQELIMPEKISIYQSSGNSWACSLSVKQLLDHLKRICHSSITSLQFGANVERFSLESIHKNVKDVESISLTSGNHEHNRRILNCFEPPSINFELDALVNGSVPRDVLILNLDVICASHVQMTLRDFLMTNARGIDMSCRQLSAKILNRFLKLWTNGSNSRLEWMHLRFDANFQNEELFWGLKAEYAPRNRLRLFKASGDKMPKQVIGGWDIWRLDGTQATITVLKNVGCVNFKLFVWYDHCVVD